MTSSFGVFILHLIENNTRAKRRDRKNHTGYSGKRDIWDTLSW
jgi:hypothetical protein